MQEWIDAELCKRYQLPLKITASPPKPASITFLEPVQSTPYSGERFLHVCESFKQFEDTQTRA